MAKLKKFVLSGLATSAAIGTLFLSDGLVAKATELAKDDNVSDSENAIDHDELMRINNLASDVIENFDTDDSNDNEGLPNVEEILLRTDVEAGSIQAKREEIKAYINSHSEIIERQADNFLREIAEAQDEASLNAIFIRIKAMVQAFEDRKTTGTGLEDDSLTDHRGVIAEDALEKKEDDSQEVNVQDVKIRNSILKLLGKAELPDYKLTKRDLRRLTSLSPESCGAHDSNEKKIKVHHLEGLQFAENLKRLSLTYQAVTDLSPILGLERLEELDLRGNDNDGVTISDISPLKNLTRLSVLNLSQAKVTDFAPLTNLTRMVNLNLMSTGIADLSPLRKMAKLEYLDLDYNDKIKDLTPLKNATALKTLKLDKHANKAWEEKTEGITDLSPLMGMSNLEELSIMNHSVQDIKPVQELKKLKRFAANNNEIKDLHPLLDLPALEVVWVDGNKEITFGSEAAYPKAKKLQAKFSSGQLTKADKSLLAAVLDDAAALEFFATGSKAKFTEYAKRLEKENQVSIENTQNQPKPKIQSIHKKWGEKLTQEDFINAVSIEGLVPKVDYLVTVVDENQLPTVHQPGTTKVDIEITLLADGSILKDQVTIQVDFKELTAEQKESVQLWKKKLQSLVKMAELRGEDGSWGWSETVLQAIEAAKEGINEDRPMLPCFFAKLYENLETSIREDYLAYLQEIFSEENEDYNFAFFGLLGTIKRIEKYAEDNDSNLTPKLQEKIQAGKTTLKTYTMFYMDPEIVKGMDQELQALFKTFKEKVESKNLEIAKEAAKLEIKSLGLAKQVEADFLAILESVATAEDVQKVLEKARALKKEQDEEAKKLNEAKETAKTGIAKLDLSEEKLTAFNKQVDEAETVDAVNAVVEKAKKEAEQAAEKTMADEYKASIEVEDVSIEFGGTVFEEAILNAVTVEGLERKPKESRAAEDKWYSLALAEGQKLPDGKTAGSFPINVVVTFSDGSKTEVTVNVTVKEKAKDDGEELPQEQSFTLAVIADGVVLRDEKFVGTLAAAKEELKINYTLFTKAGKYEFLNIDEQETTLTAYLKEVRKTSPLIPLELAQPHEGNHSTINPPLEDVDPNGKQPITDTEIDLGNVGDLEEILFPDKGELGQGNEDQQPGQGSEGTQKPVQGNESQQPNEGDHGSQKPVQGNEGQQPNEGHQESQKPGQETEKPAKDWLELIDWNKVKELLAKKGDKKPGKQEEVKTGKKEEQKAIKQENGKKLPQTSASTSTIPVAFGLALLAVGTGFAFRSTKKS